MASSPCCGWCSRRQSGFSPELCEQLLEICKQNLGTTVIDPGLPVLTEQRSVNRKLSKTADMMFGLINNILTILNRIKEKDEAPALKALATGMSNLFTKTRDAAAAKDDSPAQAPVLVARHCDFNYVQDRVHAFGEDIHEGSIVPVQRLNIFRQTYRNDGQMGKYPWTVKITNAKAPVHFQDTGATSFSSAKMTDMQEAFIMLSDTDMYRMMSRVCHFITAWECSIGADVIRQGRKRRTEERAQNRPTAAIPW